MLKKMRKKLKQEKGFTLVELLAVIAILGIILAIAIPTIGNIISNSENEAKEANVNLILNAARLADAAGEFSGDSMTVEELKEGGYLDSVPEVPGTDGDYSTGEVKKESNGKFSYSGPGESE
ncbi:prepilin-type N-terminal cleavage/methylation domain-containing protein [Ornithinibacillus sp. L9]|uniref:Prepilin-type N-terminal cleavage/methylation domain-containing protein n=1 Tax=Ornithinibacillus caprae TaxID=2678566 RepID=A0A6N8FBY0_9BACI|nr:prepilin-type N-terminal cleavage/methylation domain-containing protein [Ornithinibacillus caprae]MUK86855.1 prepilin-type N-terminal cleavage/methylation domain-containing protein [Ornithinibacillus caprae]